MGNITREELVKRCKEVGEAIAEGIKGSGIEGVGFALLIFDFGGGGNLAWISNAQREDMLEALKEFMEKEGISDPKTPLQT